VQSIYPQIRALGGEVLAISFSPPDRVAAYIQRYPQPFPVLCDPDRLAYRTFALEKTSWGSMLRPASIWRYLKLMLRGWRPWSPAKNEDLLQLGGDFILDEQRRLLFAYKSKEPTDRPAVEELLNVLRSKS
jgi:alkyl-hydroperoxide reductase/thiol specific antioxidant family protein